MKKLFGLFRYTFYNLAIGDETWGTWRMFILAIIGGCMVVLSLVLKYIMMVPNAYRVWLPLLAIPFILVTGAAFIKDIYELDKLTPWTYLIASIFGSDYPAVEIENGEIKNKRNDGETIISTIGGPGRIKINRGNVVVIDHLKGPFKILGQGGHTISRFQKVNFIGDLQELHEPVEPFEVITKDGIRVIVDNVQFIYRIWVSKKDRAAVERSLTDRIPYSEEGLSNLISNIAIGADGTFNWHNAVKGAVKGTISGYIQSHSANQLFEPEAHNLRPREDLIDALSNSASKEKFKKIGAELVWFDVGNYYPVNEDAAKRLKSYWETEKRGRARLSIAEGKAEKVALKELGQNESQTILLNVIDKAINDLELPADEEKILKRLFQLEITNLLDTLSTPDDRTK